jgi:hypothetical protein
LLGGSAWAGVTVSHFPPNPGVLPGGGWQYTKGTTFGNPVGPRQWTNGTYGARVADTAALSTPKGGTINATATATISPVELALGVATCLGRGAPLCVAGTAAGMLFDAYRIKPDGAGGLTSDPGTPPVNETQTVYAASVDCYNMGGCTATQGSQHYTAYFASQAEALAALPATMYSYGAGQTVTKAVTGGPPWTCRYNYGDGSLARSCGVTNGEPQQVSGCPASTDPTNPAYNVPAGSPIGADGKCPTARYNHAPITPQAAAQKYAPSGGDPGAQGLQAIKDAVASGIEFPVSAPLSLTGPAASSGAPVVKSTTGPNGTTTTTTTTTNNYNYNNSTSTITYNTSVTTSTSVNGAPPTVETETTTAPEPESECVKHPDTVGCTPMGDAPTDEVPRANSTLVFSAESVALPVACPAPYPLGNGTSFDFVYLCEVATLSRPVVIALAALSAALLCLAAIRGGS